MDLVDTHCHIQSIGRTTGDEGTRQRWAKAKGLTADKVVKDAAEAGVTKLICVGCDLEDSRLAIDFVQKRANCWATIGIHPHEARHFFHDESSSALADFAKLAIEPKVVAVGECGLDYFYEHSPREVQLKALEFQLELAAAADLPLIFHVREAFDDFWPIFDKYQGLSGVLHSFTDTAANLEKALARGLHVGVNGIATFTKDKAQTAVYKQIPLEKLLLETDSPFLTPTPYRGKINEPKYLGGVASYLADLRGESLDDLAMVTTANARQLFGI